MFVAFVSFILVLSISATIYDQKRIETENLSTSQQILLAFSLPQNFNRLMSKPNTKLGQDLAFVQAIRFLTMVIVIIGHVDMGFNMNPANPDFIESRYHSLWGQFFINGTPVVQTFFIMSGGLLVIHFIFELRDKRTYNFNYFWIAVIGRYLRLTPVYAFMLLFDATLLHKTNSGPFWKPIAENERFMCRKNYKIKLF